MATTLNHYHKLGLKSMSDAGREFQPRGQNQIAVAEQLVQSGLAERGPCSHEYAGYKVGYRLTEDGRQELDRLSV